MPGRVAVVPGRVAVLTPVPGAEIEAAVRRAGERNPFLGIGIGAGSDAGAGAGNGAGAGSGAAAAPPGSGRDAGRWRGPDAAALAADLIDQVGARLRIAERRVAASMVVLGYAARLVGPAVAVLARDSIVLDLSPERVTVTFSAEGGFGLSVTPPLAGRRGPAAELTERWRAVVVEGHLRPVVDAVRAVVPVAEGLLWGNVASGVTGAVIALARDGTLEPEACHRLGLALLDGGPLASAGDLTLVPATGAAPARVRFTRRSCCLYYRLPGGGTCADCCLTAPGAR